VASGPAFSTSGINVLEAIEEAAEAKIHLDVITQSGPPYGPRPILRMVDLQRLACAGIVLERRQVFAACASQSS
jgi:hypothetical protein